MNLQEQKDSCNNNLMAKNNSPSSDSLISIIGLGTTSPSAWELMSASSCLYIPSRDLK